MAHVREVVKKNVLLGKPSFKKKEFDDFLEFWRLQPFVRSKYNNSICANEMRIGRVTK